MQNAEAKSLTGRLFVPSLVVAFFSTSIIEFLTSIFLLDLTETFFGSTNQVLIATTSQLVTLSSIVSVIFAVILGVFSVRFDHRKLLLLGSVAVTIGILGCLIAPNFLFMQIFFPIEGIGSMIIGAMALTLVGEFLVLKERPKAVGWIIAGGPIASILGSLVITLFFSGGAGWRSYLLWFTLPISFVSLIAVYFWVPSVGQKEKTIKKQDFLNSFKKVFLKKSATSCLIGIMFRQAAVAWGAVYYASFLIEQFGLSLPSTALFSLIGAIVFAMALIVGGYFVNRIGRKRQLVSTLIVASLLLIPVPFLNDLFSILLLSWIGGFIFGMSFPATTSLILEQAPDFRGTMMSMSTIFVTFGIGLGTAIGGLVLIVSGWTGLILTFAALQLTASAIYYFLTKDPCEKKEEEGFNKNEIP